MPRMDWEMLHKDASKLIGIGDCIFTLSAMETSHGLRGAIVGLHSDGGSNGEIASRGLEAVLAAGEGVQIELKSVKL